MAWVTLWVEVVVDLEELQVEAEVQDMISIIIVSFFIFKLCFIFFFYLFMLFA